MNPSTTTTSQKPPVKGGPPQAQPLSVKTMMALDYPEEEGKPGKPLKRSKKTSKIPWSNFNPGKYRIDPKTLADDLEQWQMKAPNALALLTDEDLYNTFMKEEASAQSKWAESVMKGGAKAVAALASASAPFELIDFAKEQLMDKVKEELLGEAAHLAEDGVKFVANAVRRRKFKDAEEFKKSGIQKAQKAFVEDVGKHFVGFSMALAFGGSALTGGIGAGFAILFSIVVYLDAVDAAKEKQMRYEIYQSIMEKYNRIKEESQKKIWAARVKKAERSIMSNFQQDREDVEVLGRIMFNSGQIRPVLWADVHNMRAIAGDFEFPRNEYGTWTRLDLAILFANHLNEITYILENDVKSSDPLYKKVQASIKEVSQKMTDHYAKMMEIPSERFSEPVVPKVVEDLDPIPDEDDMYELTPGQGEKSVPAFPIKKATK